MTKQIEKPFIQPGTPKAEARKTFKLKPDSEVTVVCPQCGLTRNIEFSNYRSNWVHPIVVKWRKEAADQEKKEWRKRRNNWTVREYINEAIADFAEAPTTEEDLEAALAEAFQIACDENESEIERIKQERAQRKAQREAEWQAWLKENGKEYFAKKEAETKYWQNIRRRNTEFERRGYRWRCLDIIAESSTNPEIMAMEAADLGDEFGRIKTFVLVAPDGRILTEDRATEEIGFEFD